MSTEIRDASDDARHRLTASGGPAGPLVIFHLSVRSGLQLGQADMDRADFLAAVETECGVRIVAADAIVIERADLTPAVLVDGPRILAADGTTLGFVGDKSMRTQALRLLSAVEYLAAHPPVPPVSDEDVETLAGLVLAGHDPAGGIGHAAAAATTARRLLATGRVAVTK